MADDSPPELEGIVLQVVTTFLARRLKAKNLEWQAAEEKEKIARTAFLACRSRTGADFVDFFAATLCSVPQHVTDEKFRALSRALRDRPDEVRTLTMLALSARG